MATDRIVSLLGDQADYLLQHTCTKVRKEDLHLPSPRFVDDYFISSNRSNPTLRALQTLYGTGRLANSGYLSILPVDQGVEHSAGASFAPNPIYFDPENIIKLGIDKNSLWLIFTINGILWAYLRLSMASPPKVDATALHSASMANLMMFSGSK